MRVVVSVMLVVVGIIHLLPLSGVLGRGRLKALYDLSLSDPNLILLMRHRAVLFGLLGLFLLLAAFQPKYQLAAFIAGFVSVISFLWLAWPLELYNTQIGRVFWVDVTALIFLSVGAAAYGYQGFAR